ncbi:MULTISPECIES: hypothetical protein [Idiomarina]|uniref:hypothetical protein n=1 Tax=Idiomarina TaxID=135575 RepID=UPI00129C2F75|nr:MULTISPECIES: hypothetical protein [Idiomarina]MRJ42195.1 hypothetical protein [Idiomarina sp. FeN1]NCU57121.1 hypothetical protein [Idiomarina sp. FenA--70]NCU59830.1 hypothetical protein [Idiomarina sp. FenBw--71]UUN13179.1 hypothetical protein KGF88_11175 [Idiomarina loihiensis]
MKNLSLALTATLLALTLAVGCAKQPTRTTTIADTAPQVSFKVADAAGLELVVDGVSYGDLAQYTYPERAVQLVPGQHLIIVRQGEQVIYQESRYFSEATQSTITINE